MPPHGIGIELVGPDDLIGHHDNQAALPELPDAAQGHPQVTLRVYLPDLCRGVEAMSQQDTVEGPVILFRRQNGWKGFWAWTIVDAARQRRRLRHVASGSMGRFSDW
jgi:hypothetical protein